ncbi:MAG: MFS transporter [Woeseia sp.]
MQTSALRNRNYRLYLLGNIVSLHGVWVYRVAVGWEAWQLTQSELWVGVLAFTQFFPIVVFGPLFGVLADRFDRRRASILINTTGTFIMLLLATLMALGLVNIYVLCLLSLMQGIADGAHTPVRLALVPNLVQRHQLQSAMAINSIAFNLSRFIGPAIAGVLIATLGVAYAVAFNGFSYIAILAALLVIRIEPFRQSAESRSDVLGELMIGVRYAMARPALRHLLGLVAMASFFGRGPLELLPAFAESVFDRGSTGLAILTSSAGAGAICAGVIISRGLFRLRIRYIAVGIAIAAALIVLLGVAPWFWFGVAIVTGLGFMLTLCGVGAQVLLQTLIDDELRGRVSSLWGMIAFGGTAFGGLVVGAIASLWGLPATTMAIGIVCLMLTLQIYMRRVAANRSA